MKRIFLILLLISPFTNANNVTYQGNVEFVRTHSPSIMGIHSDWIALKGVSTAGTCRAWNGNVVFRLSNEMDRAHSLAVKAQLEGKILQVNIDDNLKDSSGACWIRWLNIVD